MISLTPETETRLRERAEREGQDADAFADAILAEVLADDPDDLTPEEMKEIRAGVRRGLDAAAAGRVKPLSKAITEARQRHGFPDTWASGAAGRRPV
jgi:predicted transcriptional regulator